MRHNQQRPVELGPTVFPDKPRKHHPRQTQLGPALCVSDGPEGVVGAGQAKLGWGGG